MSFISKNGKLSHRVALILGGMSLAISSYAQTAPTLTWASWTAPASYPLTATGPAGNYNYTNQISGVLNIPNGSPVDVTLTGEVMSNSCYAATNAECSAANLYASGWVNGPLGPYPAGTFTSANVPSLPSNANQITMAGFAPGATVHTLTFSQPVSNIVMDIGSLGSPNNSATYTFTQDFAILSQDPTQSAFVKSGLNLTGKESSGTIQFAGTFTSLTWTISQPEWFAAFNFGATSAAVPTPPTIVTAAPGDASATFTLSPPPGLPSGTTVTSYAVTCTPTGGGSAVTATGTSPLAMAGMFNGTTYDCTAVAHESDGSVSQSSVPATVTPHAQVAAPTNTAVPGDSSATITVTPPPGLPA
ncbi:hypothetical protein ACFIQG_21895, partial [Comamonas odontotermitis]|uniref:hypothetical protein n=1 Tax=Comamonas odontotermitis TaxID=379895 RepID=UPI00366C1EA0